MPVQTTAHGRRVRQRRLKPKPANGFAELWLPYPPSANTAYRNVPGKGRVKTERYNAWIQHATVKTVPPPGLVAGRIDLVMQLTPPDRRKRDLTNVIKCTEDFLVRRGVIEDDSLVESLYIRWWREGEPGVRVMVTAHNLADRT